MLVEFRDGSKFLSTPSARRATRLLRCPSVLCRISIHALREEGDFNEIHKTKMRYISIHALREEGDPLSSPSVTTR